MSQPFTSLFMEQLESISKSMGALKRKNCFHGLDLFADFLWSLRMLRPTGVRYPLVISTGSIRRGGTGQRHAGASLSHATCLKTRRLPPIGRMHR